MNRARDRVIAYASGLPRWFRISFSIIALIYFAAWIWTVYIHIHGGAGVHIPVLPKDSSGYAALSDSILHAHSFTAADGLPETFRTPGYPAFIALVRSAAGGSFLAVTFIQMLLMLAAGLIIQRIGTRYVSSKAGSLAALAFLVNPLTLTLALVVLSDALFTFCYLLFFWVVTEHAANRPRTTALLAGIIAAAALYVRPMGVLAFPIFLAPILISRISRKNMLISASIVAIVAVALIMPWLIRNKTETGIASFTSLTSYNIASYNIPMFRAARTGSSTGIEIQKIAADVGAGQDTWRHLTPTTLKLNTYISGFVRTNLFPYIKYHLVMTAPFFFASDIQWAAATRAIALNIPFDYGQPLIYDLAGGKLSAVISNMVHPWWKFTERLWILFLAACAIYGLYKRRRESFLWIMAGIILYIALLTGPVSDARYRFPADPFIYLVAAAGFVLILESVKQRLSSRSRQS